MSFESGDQGRTLVMGILNRTPDSFSDGGAYVELESALTRAAEMVDEGADIIDVGGESTRPGSQRVSEDEELHRVLTVVRALAADGVKVSVDTMRASVAKACAQVGAAIINDVSAGLADPQMLATIADLDVDYVSMHWRGHGDVMNQHAVYSDVVAEVLREITARVEAAEQAGIAKERIIIDPGYGFAKNAEHNWQLLAHLDSFANLGHRVLIGVSRKRFLGELLATDHGPREIWDRDAASAALTTIAAEHRVWAVRTHTVKAHRDAVEVVHRLQQTYRFDSVTGKIHD